MKKEEDADAKKRKELVRPAALSVSRDASRLTVFTKTLGAYLSKSMPQITFRTLPQTHPDLDFSFVFVAVSSGPAGWALARVLSDPEPDRRCSLAEIVARHREVCTYDS